MTLTIRQLTLSIVIALAIGMLSTPVVAHHGGGMYFEPETVGPVTGVATEFSFTFPHVQIYFDVKEQNGEVRNYAMTIRWTPPVLRKLGWTRKSIKPGDTLTVTYRPHKNSPVAGAIITLAVNGEPLQTEPEA